MIHPPYPHPCFSPLQLWDIRRKGCVFRYRVSMAMSVTYDLMRHQSQWGWVATVHCRLNLKTDLE